MNRYKVFKDNLHAKEVIVGDGLRRKRYTLCLNPKAAECQEKHRQAAKHDGKWVLETNDDTISLEDAAMGYNGLIIIERCFRSLKRTQIKMTPMYHWLSRRIEAHVKICVLTLMIERIAERTCGQPWSKIARSLKKFQVTNFFNLNHRVCLRNKNPSMPLRKDGIRLAVFSANQLLQTVTHRQKPKYAVFVGFWQLTVIR